MSLALDYHIYHSTSNFRGMWVAHVYPLFRTSQRQILGEYVVRTSRICSNGAARPVFFRSEETFTRSIQYFEFQGHIRIVHIRTSSTVCRPDRKWESSRLSQAFTYMRPTRLGSAHITNLPAVPSPSVFRPLLHCNGLSSISWSANAKRGEFNLRRCQLFIYLSATATRHGFD